MVRIIVTYQANGEDISHRSSEVNFASLYRLRQLFAKHIAPVGYFTYCKFLHKRLRFSCVGDVHGFCSRKNLREKFDFGTRVVVKKSHWASKESLACLKSKGCDFVTLPSFKIWITWKQLELWPPNSAAFNLAHLKVVMMSKSKMTLPIENRVLVTRFQK